MRGFIVKDLIRRWRSPAPTLAMLIFPLFMSGMLGMVFGGNEKEKEFPVIKVFLEDRDKTFVTELVKGAMGRDEVKKRLDVQLVGPEGRARMEKGEASALVVFPERFTDDLLDGRPTTIEVVRNPAEGIGPEIVEQGVLALSTYLDQAQRVLGAELRDVRGMMDADEMPASVRVGRLAEAINDRLRGVQKYLFPPLVQVKSVKEKAADGGENARFSIFGYILIMTTVMALLFVAARSVGDMFDERKSGMLRRQLASPADLRLIIGAKIAFGVVFGLVVTAILAAIGVALGWIRLPVSLPGAALLALAFSLASCGLLAVVFAIVSNERQAGILSWLVIMGNSALGGSMINIEGMPPAMRGMAPFTLNYWVIDGFKKLVFEGSGLAAIGRDVLVLGGVGLALTLAGYLLLMRRSREVRA